jgi:hypothetical protein
MLIIGGILAVGVYAVMRLWPLYFEYMEVARAMDQTAKENTADSTTPQELRASLNRRWAIEDIKTLQPEQMEIKRNGNGYIMRARYRAEAPFIANVSLVVDFDKTVNVR